MRRGPNNHREAKTHSERAASANRINSAQAHNKARGSGKGCRQTHHAPEQRLAGARAERPLRSLPQGLQGPDHPGHHAQTQGLQPEAHTPHKRECQSRQEKE